MKYLFLLFLNFIQAIFVVLIYNFIYTFLRLLKLNFFDYKNFINLNFMIKNFFFENVVGVGIILLNFQFMIFSFFIILLYNVLILSKSLKNSKLNSFLFFNVLLMFFYFVEGNNFYTISLKNDFIWRLISVSLTSLIVYISSKKIIEILK
jgi:hypothetical protein